MSRAPAANDQQRMQEEARRLNEQRFGKALFRQFLQVMMGSCSCSGRWRERLEFVAAGDGCNTTAAQIDAEHDQTALQGCEVVFGSRLSIACLKPRARAGGRTARIRAGAV